MLPKSFLPEISSVLILIVSYYVKEYFGFSWSMYVGLVFCLIFIIYQKL